jgi:hypothetical protein
VLFEVLGQRGPYRRVEVGDVLREGLRIGRDGEGGDGRSRGRGILLVGGMRFLARYRVLGARARCGFCWRNRVCGQRGKVADYLQRVRR